MMQASLGLGPRKPAYRTTVRRTPEPLRMSSDYEVRALCDSLGCSYQQLRAAVAAVGPSVELVQEYLAAEYLMAP